MSRPPLADPEYCRVCHVRGRVVNSRRRVGFRWRRHDCPGCGRRWSSWQMRVRPRSLRVARTGTI